MLPTRRAFALSAAFAALPLLAVEIPRPSPDFSINLPDGGRLPLKQYRGKVVALAIISTTCPHCQALTGILNQIQKDYAAKGVQVLECAMEPNGLNVPAFAQRFQPAYPIGWNDAAAILTYLQVPVIAPGYVPKMVFIDRRGIIREQHMAGQDKYFEAQDLNIRATLEHLLKPPAAAKAAKKNK